MSVVFIRHKMPVYYISTKYTRYEIYMLLLYIMFSLARFGSALAVVGETKFKGIYKIYECKVL
jgi:hypothetical protein